MSRKRATQITDQSPTSKPFLTFMERYSQIRSQRPVLQEFYGKRWVRRHQRLGAWKKKDVQRRLITNENRQFKPKTLVRAIGHAGTGVGTRTTGHLRYGGNWHRRFAAQQGIVLVTNEARTSMVCPFCRCRVMHPRKVKGGKTVTNTGTSCCINRQCEAYQHCKNSFGRDALSCTNIALRCFNLTKKDLLLFAL